MKNTAITTLFFSVMLSSCTHYYYVPNIQNVPLFREKNEYRISGSYGFGDESSCAEIQAAYSVTGKIGVMADFMTAKGGKVSDNNWGKGSYFGGAIGYYKPLGKYGVFEIYGGLAGSSQHHVYTILNYNGGTIYNSFGGTSDLSFLKVFVQPSIGLTSKTFDIAISTRISRVSFTNIDNSILGNPDLFASVNALSDKSHLFIEPCFTVRGGWKYLKIQLQAAYSGYLNSPGLHFGEELHLSVGLYVAIAGRYRKDNPKNQ